ncbi:hypothetical protein SAMN05444415_11580 [Salipiger profundus]|jgi:hypothetical protein|nr:hypothetical protein SAMN05444415_11580 [Salipiger profundus]
MTDVAWGLLPPARQGALAPEFSGQDEETGTEEVGDV